MVDVSKLPRRSKREPIPGSTYTWLETPCPECGKRLYEIPVCCGAPEGLIECNGCDFQEKPSIFKTRRRDDGSITTGDLIPQDV